MKNIKPHMTFALIFAFLQVSSAALQAQIVNEGNHNPDKPETNRPFGAYWNVKAYSPEWGLLRVKAIGEDGTIYDVKAIQDSDDTSLLDVKALINGERVAIKLIVVKNDPLYPVKAIMDDGTILDVKAIDEDGELIDIKGFSRSGNIVHLRAIRSQPIMYTIIAVSPDGKVNDVKGVKMSKEEVETEFNGVKVYAHVKALSQN